MERVCAFACMCETIVYIKCLCEMYACDCVCDDKYECTWKHVTNFGFSQMALFKPNINYLQEFH